MWGSAVWAPFPSMTYVTLVLSIELTGIGGGLMLLQRESAKEKTTQCARGVDERIISIRKEEKEGSQKRSLLDPTGWT